MAAIRPTQFGQGAIGTGAGSVFFTVQTGGTAIIKCIDICNTTAGAITVNAYVVPLAGTPATTNALLYGFSVAANSRFQWTGTQVMAAGGFMQLSASGAGCTATISGGLYAP